MKAIYRHRKSGDLFAIETDEKGAVLSTPDYDVRGQALRRITFAPFDYAQDFAGQGKAD